MVRRKSLFWMLFGSHVTLAALTIATIAIFTLIAVRRYTYATTISDLTARAELLMAALPDPLTGKNIDEVTRYCVETGERTRTRFTVMLADGAVIADTGFDSRTMENHLSRPEFVAALSGARGVADRFSTTADAQMLYVAIPLVRKGVTVGAVRASLPLFSIAASMQGIASHLMLVVILALLFTVVVSYYVAGSISRPLREMAIGAAAFSRGDMNHRLPTGAGGELADLAETLNTMAVQLEERIAANTERRDTMEAILSGMVEAVFTVDREERIIEFNPAAERFFRQRTADVTGRQIQEVARNVTLLRFVQRAIAAESLLEEEITIHNGGEHVLQAHGTRLRDASGGQIGAIIVLNDITRLKRLEKTRSDFVANVSHELKTPITSILGFIETLRDGAIDDTENRTRFLQIVHKQAERLNGIIGDLLTLSRIEQESEQHATVREPHRLPDILSEAAEACAATAAERSVSITVESEDVILPADASLLEQAVINLIDNGLKYTNPGGSVTVRGFLHTDDNDVVIEVTDTGCGIPQEHQSRIFERFYRVDKGRSREMGGTGLGLAIVKHIVLAHGGRIEVESHLGEGSTFTIHLPTH